MDDTCSSDSSLVWLWVIEHLASLREIDLSILQELIEAAPDLPEDLSKNTREWVALRCLEDLFDPSKGPTNGVSSAPDQKVTLNFSESCEHVLQSILQETTPSDLKMAGPTLLKWDVHPFIMHKRSSMPKCALEQLKDAILEGTHPYAASLKNLSGMVHTSYEVHKDARIPADCGDLNSVTWRINGSSTDAQIMAPEGNSIPQLLESENRAVRDDSHDRNLLPFKRDRCNLAIENLAGDYHGNQGCIDDGSDLNLNAKRFKQNASCTDQSVEQIVIPLLGNEVEEDSSKRMVGGAEKGDFQLEKESELGGSEERRSLENDHYECDAINMLRQSHDVGGIDEQILIPPLGKEVEEDSSKRMVGDTEKGDFQVEKESEVRGSEERRSLENGQDESDAINTLRQSHDVDGVHEWILIPPLGKEVEEDSSKRMVGDIGKGDFKVEKESEVGGSEERRSLENDRDECVAINMLRQSHDVDGVDELWHNPRETAHEAEGGMEHVCEEDMSLDSDDHDYDHERVDFAMRKSHFLSSQCASLNFPETVYWAEQNLCVKCSKDGQLLVCCAVGCPLAVHENCLSSPARFDAEGNFYCPFCAYSLDISDYLEDKRHTSLSKKDFDSFIDMVLEHQPKKHTRRLHIKRDDYLKDKRHTSLSKKDFDSFIDMVLEHQPKKHTRRLDIKRGGHSGKKGDDVLHKIRDNQSLGEGECNQANNESHMSEDNDHQFQNKKGNEQVLEPLASCAGVSLLDREEELDVNGGSIHIANVEKEGEGMVQECMSVQALDGQQDLVCADLKCNGDNISCRNKENVSVTCNQENNEGCTCEDNHHQFQKGRGNEQLVEPLASCIGVSLLSREEKLDVSGGKNHISNAEKEGEEMVQECPSEQGPDGQQHQVYANLKRNGHKISCKNKKIVSGGEIQKEILERTDSLEKPICAISIGGGGTYEQENVESIISSYSMRSQRREMQYTFPASPNLRRKKVPWTTEEEEILKEGVRKFSSMNENIPWKKILERGNSIFLNGRTAIDLKDKWRNMCKRSPKS